MIRKFAGVIAVIALLSFAVPAVGAEGKTQHYGPFASTTPDNGTCQNSWAEDTVNRDFMVQQNKDGTFQVREEFKDGTFVTNAGPSPGGCETTDTHHGTTVLAGITGSFHGNLDGVVTGGTYNPNGCSAVGANCTTTSGFITATFPGGQFSCSVGFGSCTFQFHYAAGDQGLIFHEWNESSSKDQTFEVDKGDIASA